VHVDVEGVGSGDPIGGDVRSRVGTPMRVISSRIDPPPFGFVSLAACVERTAPMMAATPVGNPKNPATMATRTRSLTSA